MENLGLEESHELPASFFDDFLDHRQQVQEQFDVVDASVITPVIQNIVSSVDLDCKLDLSSISSRARNSEYNPRRFSAVIMRIREPKTTALIFATGKLVCTGAKTEEDSKLAARKFARIIQKLGFAVRFNNFKIQNIVGSCDTRFPIRLESLCCAHGKFCIYEPEIFPGLVYRMKNPTITVLIFASGKVVLAGAKAKEDIFMAFQKLYPTLEQYHTVVLHQSINQQSIVSM